MSRAKLANDHIKALHALLSTKSEPELRALYRGAAEHIQNAKIRTPHMNTPIYGSSDYYEYLGDILSASALIMSILSMVVIIYMYGGDPPDPPEEPRAALLHAEEPRAALLHAEEPRAALLHAEEPLPQASHPLAELQVAQPRARLIRSLAPLPKDPREAQAARRIVSIQEYRNLAFEEIKKINPTLAARYKSSIGHADILYGNIMDECAMIPGAAGEIPVTSWRAYLFIKRIEYLNLDTPRLGLELYYYCMLCAILEFEGADPIKLLEAKLSISAMYATKYFKGGRGLIKSYSIRNYMLATLEKMSVHEIKTKYNTIKDVVFASVSSHFENLETCILKMKAAEDYNAHMINRLNRIKEKITGATPQSREANHLRYNLILDIIDSALDMPSETSLKYICTLMHYYDVCHYLLDIYPLYKLPNI